MNKIPVDTYRQAAAYYDDTMVYDGRREMERAVNELGKAERTNLAL